MSLNPIKYSLNSCVKNDSLVYEPNHIQNLIVLCRGEIPKFGAGDVSSAIAKGILACNKFKSLLKYYMIIEQLATQPDIGYNFSLSMISQRQGVFNMNTMDPHQVASFKREAKFGIAFDLVHNFSKIVEAELLAISSNVLLKSTHSNLNSKSGFGSTGNTSNTNSVGYGYINHSSRTGGGMGSMSHSSSLSKIDNLNDDIVANNTAFSSVTEIAEISFSFETKFNTLEKLLRGLATEASCLKMVPFEHKNANIILLNELIARVSSIWTRAIAALMHTAAAALKIQKRAYLYHATELNESKNMRYHNSLSKMVAIVAKLGTSVQDYFAEISSAVSQYTSNANIVGSNDDVLITLQSIAADIVTVPAPILSSVAENSLLTRQLMPESAKTEQQIQRKATTSPSPTILTSVSAGSTATNMTGSSINVSNTIQPIQPMMAQTTQAQKINNPFDVFTASRSSSLASSAVQSPQSHAANTNIFPSTVGVSSSTYTPPTAKQTVMNPFDLF